MYRYVVPLAFFAGALGVRAYNHAHRFKKVVFPGLDKIPALEDDIYGQGEWSWYILALLGLLLTLFAAFTSYSDARQKRIERKGHKP